MIRFSNLGDKPYETLVRVARYYMDNGASEKDARTLTEKFLTRCDPSVSVVKWADTLNSAVSRASSKESVNIDSIDITAPEMERIEQLGSRPCERLAFTLLCLSKYWDYVSDTNNCWVRNSDSEVMRMANIKAPVRKQCGFYTTLSEAGMIRFPKRVDSTSVMVLFQADGDAVMHVTDFRNLGYQYHMYHGEPYFVCRECGITEKKTSPDTGRPQRFCRECASKRMVRQKVNYAMTK